MNDSAPQILENLKHRRGELSASLEKIQNELKPAVLKDKALQQYEKRPIILLLSAFAIGAVVFLAIPKRKSKKQAKIKKKRIALAKMNKKLSKEQKAEVLQLIKQSSKTNKKTKLAGAAKSGISSLVSYLLSKQLQPRIQKLVAKKS